MDTLGEREYLQDKVSRKPELVEANVLRGRQISVNSLNWVPCRCYPRLRWISSCVPGRLVDSQNFRHGRGWCHGLEGRLIGDDALFKERGAGKS